MSNILVRPPELRQASEQLKASAKKIGIALQAIDNDIRTLKGEKFLGNRASAVQAHYAPKREALLKAQNIVAHFAEDLQAVAGRFEQADKNGGSPPPMPVIPSKPPIIKPPSKNKMPDLKDIILNQWDKRWANLKMNNATSHTLRNYGCLMTVVSMIARANGVDATPEMVDTWIEAHGGYPAGASTMSINQQAAFLNDVLGKKGGMSKIYSDNSTQHGMPNINHNIDAGNPVILHIDSKTNPADGHFVLAIGVDAKGNYICADPNGGKQITVSAGQIRDARVYQ